MDGAHRVPFRILYICLTAVQLHSVRGTDEVDIVYWHRERKRHLIAGLRDFQRERLGIALLTIHFLAIETPSSEQRVGSGIDGHGKKNHARGHEECSFHLLLLSFTQKMS